MEAGRITLKKRHQHTKDNALLCHRRTLACMLAAAAFKLCTYVHG